MGLFDKDYTATQGKRLEKNQKSLEGSTKELLGNQTQANAQISTLKGELEKANLTDKAETAQLNAKIAKVTGAINGGLDGFGISMSLAQDLPEDVRRVYRRAMEDGVMTPAEAIRFSVAAIGALDDRTDQLEATAKIAVTQVARLDVATQALRAELAVQGYVASTVGNGGVLSIGKRTYPLRHLILNYVLSTATKLVYNDGTLMPKTDFAASYMQGSVTADVTGEYKIAPLAPFATAVGVVGTPLGGGLKYIAAPDGIVAGQSWIVDGNSGFSGDIIVIATCPVRITPDLARLATFAAMFGVGEALMGNFAGSAIGGAAALSSDGLITWAKSFVGGAE